MKGLETVLARRMPSVADVTVAVLCLAAAFMPLFRHAPSGPSRRVVVYRDDVPVAAVDAACDTLLAVTGAIGATLVQVRDGRACITESCCPNGICREQGWISRPGSWVLCLPNRIMVKVVGPGGEEGVDAVSR